MARRLGFNAVAVEFVEGLGEDELEEASSRHGVRVYTRVTLRASTRREARRAYDSAPRADIVVLEAEGLDAARYGAVKEFIHLVRITPGMEKAVDRSQARLLREKGWGGIEVSLAYARRFWRDPSTWRFYQLVLRRAFAYDINVVLVSDASSVDELWSPHSAAGVAEATGVPGDYALTWMSSVPASIIGRAGRGPGIRRGSGRFEG